MIIGAFYISMIMTNWSAQDMTESTFVAFTPNNFSMWIKLLSGYFTAVLYMWTVVAARVLGSDDDEAQVP